MSCHLPSSTRWAALLSACLLQGSPGPLCLVQSLSLGTERDLCSLALSLACSQLPARKVLFCLLNLLPRVFLPSLGRAPHPHSQKLISALPSLQLADVYNNQRLIRLPAQTGVVGWEVQMRENLAPFNSPWGTGTP